MDRENLRSLMKIAHYEAKKYEGHFHARLSLALKKVWSEWDRESDICAEDFSKFGEPGYPDVSMLDCWVDMPTAKDYVFDLWVKSMPDVRDLYMDYTPDGAVKKLKELHYAEYADEWDETPEKMLHKFVAESFLNIDRQTMSIF